MSLYTYPLATLTLLIKTLEILDFNYFKSNILNPIEYIDKVKKTHKEGDYTDKIPSYISVYKTLYNICNK